MENIEFLDNCSVNDVEFHYVRITCNDKEKNWIFYTSKNIQNQSDPHTINKIYNLIYEWLFSHDMTCSYQGQDNLWKFFIDDKNLDEDLPPYYINVASFLKSYPKTFMERVNRVMLNLSNLSANYGEVIHLGNNLDTHRLLMNELLNNGEEINFVLPLIELGYLRESPNMYHVIITAEGWKLIDELKRKSNEIKQGFIAMRFGADTKDIRTTFKRAISDSGFAVSVIDEKEHNNQIVPEIFFEIERSKFMVVDITYPNYGAYYEAGYGQALGKEVIVCCSKEVFNSEEKSKRPHFDIAQKSTIVWDDLDDLYERLKRRIEATVK